MAYVSFMNVNESSKKSPTSASASASAGQPRPLDGVRVVDMTTVLMGPLATQILGDYGADVIKVEPPEGDVMRHAGEGKHAQMGPMYLSTGRNKRSLVLDIKQPEGKAALLKLVATADLFIHNVRPAAMHRAGLGYDELKAVNPSIVYVSLVGFGQDGPYAARPAFDDIIQAACGVAGLFTRAGHDEPAFIPANWCDRMTGQAAAHAVMAALFMRERTGQGQAIEVPMFETLVQMVLGDHLNGAAFVPQHGPTGYGRLLNVHRKPFRTQDGFIALTPYSDKHFRAFFAAIGQEARFADDARINSHAARARHYDVAYGLLAEVLTERSTDDWLALCKAIEVPAQRFNTLEDLLADEHLQQVGFFETAAHPSEGEIVQMRPAARWSGADLSMRRLPPAVGQDSVAVLGELGYSAAQIEAMLASGAAKGV